MVGNRTLTRCRGNGGHWCIVGLRRCTCCTRLRVLLANNTTRSNYLLHKLATDQNIGKRRVAIHAQIKSSTNTDSELLSKHIPSSICSPGIFLRWEIRWALREYSQNDLDWVNEIVVKHPALSELNWLEPLKCLAHASGCCKPF